MIATPSPDRSADVLMERVRHVLSSGYGDARDAYDDLREIVGLPHLPRYVRALPWPPNHLPGRSNLGPRTEWVPSAAALDVALSIDPRRYITAEFRQAVLTVAARWIQPHPDDEDGPRVDCVPATAVARIVRDYITALGNESAGLRAEVERLTAKVDRERQVRKGQVRDLIREVLLRQSVSDAGWDRAADAEAEVARLRAGINDAIPYLGERELAEPILRAAHNSKETDNTLEGEATL